MATGQVSALQVEPRDPGGSRAARRLRRAGKIPGVVYGGGEQPVAFAVDVREMRLALAHAGAVLQLKVGDGAPAPVVLKELARHPVTGEPIHIDLLRVRLDRPIHATVALHLVGQESAPGVREGGVLDQTARELHIEALPTDIPDFLEHDVSGMAIGDTLTVRALSVPTAVRLLDDPEMVVASVTPPRLQVEEEPGIEEETELVAGAEAAAGPPAEQAAAAGESESAGE